MVPKQNCAFVTFTTRLAAEAAAEGAFNKLVIRQQRLKILWGKAQGQTAVSGEMAGPSKLAPISGLRKYHLYWKDASLNTLDFCIGGMHPLIH